MVQNSFQLQKRLKNYSKNWFFSKFSNDLKNVSRHCGSHYNIKIKHSEDFSCQIGLTSGECSHYFWRKIYSQLTKTSQVLTKSLLCHNGQANSIIRRVWVNLMKLISLKFFRCCTSVTHNTWGVRIGIAYGEIMSSLWGFVHLLHFF